MDKNLKEELRAWGINKNVWLQSNNIAREHDDYITRLKEDRKVLRKEKIFWQNQYAKEANKCWDLFFENISLKKQLKKEKQKKLKAIYRRKEDVKELIRGILPFKQTIHEKINERAESNY